MDYDAACKAATTRQGLDPVLEALDDLEGVGLEQTGGFCMVVTVTRDDGVFAITNEGEKAYVGWYAGNAWHETGDVDSDQYVDVSELRALVM